MAASVSLACAAQGGRIAWVAPSYRNSRPMWRMAEQMTRPVSSHVTVRRAERTVDFPGGGSLGVYSADNPTSILGESFDLVVVDEAARVPEDTWTETIMPTLADRNGRAMLISTPKGKNWFWREYQRGVAREPGYASFTAPSSDNPNPNIRAAAEQARMRVSDRIYRQEWLAEFVEELGVTFMREWFEGNRYDPDDSRLRNLAVARWHSWDTALSDKEDTAAYSSLVVGELLPDYRMVVREVWRDHLTFPELIAAIERFAHRDARDKKLRNVIIEDKGSGTSAIQTIKATTGWLAPLLVPFWPSTSKEQRAEQASVWCSNRSVLLPQPSASARWLEPFENELFEFPGSVYKDQVDAFSQLVLYTENLLAEGHRARTAQR